MTEQRSSYPLLADEDSALLAAAGNRNSLTVLSLGAGVQSTALLLLAANGELPKPDAAIFADTGWEPQGVYDHLDRLEREVAIPAGIPIYRVQKGNIRTDALTTRRVQMPLYLKVDTDRGAGTITRSCTFDYKVVPIKAKVRELLGYPHPKPVPRGLQAVQWIGISRDEFQRAKDAQVKYLRNAFPLLSAPLTGSDGREGWTRNDCTRYLTQHGFGATPKSACIGCPFHRNAAWRDLRDNHPAEWADAVDFDRRIREDAVHVLKGEAFLHGSLLPLSVAPIDVVTRREWNTAQGDIFDAVADEAPSCSPWSCRGDAA